MTAKFISTVLKAASVVAVPLAMLAASTPAGAQRPGRSDHSEWHHDNGRYSNERYGNERYDNGHHKKAHHKDREKNRNYKNGYYRNGHDNDGRYGSGNGYPSRSAPRYPSSPVIPGFPNPVTPNGRTGKVLPGTNQQYPQNQQYQQNGAHRRRY
jgi:Ni/Co efflux regulator RcnB